MSRDPEAKRATLTTTGGIPVADNQTALTAGPRGPLLVQDWQLFEKHAHFNRERIPERVVHAKGSAAFGTLTGGLDAGHPEILGALQPAAKIEALMTASGRIARFPLWQAAA